jgi:hypothetical protein
LKDVVTIPIFDWTVPSIEQGCEKTPMRLWSLHPGYLDAKGLVALWREGLLAQKVLLGNTRGYKNHPQLTRFRNTGNPAGAIASYLRAIADEAARRGYHFDRRRIANRHYRGTLPVTQGQLDYELAHLRIKLQARAPEFYQQSKALTTPASHPLLRVVPGEVEAWEVVQK